MADAALFTRRRHRPLVRDVADHLRRRIVSGDVRVGRQLPAMRRLARLYGVSLPTMQAALHALESVGFVRITHGVGTFVAEARSPSRLLVYVWQEATIFELAAMRATIDEAMPVLAARMVATRRGGRLPRAVQDLSFLASERSASRRGLPAEAFARADHAFHRAIAMTVRGTEVSVSLYEQIGRRMQPMLAEAAAVQAGDDGLDASHRALASAIINGSIPAAARLASAIARREMESVHAAVREG